MAHAKQHNIAIMVSQPRCNPRPPCSIDLTPAVRMQAYGPMSSPGTMSKQGRKVPNLLEVWPSAALLCSQCLTWLVAQGSHLHACMPAHYMPVPSVGQCTHAEPAQSAHRPDMSVLACSTRRSARLLRSWGGRRLRCC